MDQQRDQVEEPKSSTWRLDTQTITLATIAAPIFSTILTCSFELGSCSYYGIPIDLISVTPTNVIVTLWWFGIVLLLLFMMPGWIAYTLLVKGKVRISLSVAMALTGAIVGWYFFNR